MALRTIIEPTSEPVLLSTAKSFLRLDLGDTSEDLLVGALITVARRWCERYCRRRFIYQTVRLEMDFFPGYVDSLAPGFSYGQQFYSGANAVLAGIRYAIRLPFPPVHRIAAFSFTAPNGNVTEVSPATGYLADLDSQPARLTPPFGQFWPIAQITPNAVLVDFVTGYGANVAVTANTQGKGISSPFTFNTEDVGSAITIPGAGVGGGNLSTSIASVASGVATLADQPAVAVDSILSYVGEQMPLEICHAILMFVGHLYNNREAAVMGGGAGVEVPMGVKSLLFPYRDLRV